MKFVFRLFISVDWRHVDVDVAELTEQDPNEPKSPEDGKRHAGTLEETPRYPAWECSRLTLGAVGLGGKEGGLGLRVMLEIHTRGLWRNGLTASESGLLGWVLTLWVQRRRGR